VKSNKHQLLLRSGPISSVDLPDGKRVDVSWFKDGDRKDLLAFYRDLPAEDRLYLRSDVTNQAILDRLVDELHEGIGVMIVCREGAAIIGECTQHFIHHGWSRHVSELRHVVRREFEGHGLEEIMIKEHIEVANDLGLDKVIVRLLELQKEKQRILESLGFEREAVLRSHATDLRGARHNMVIMSNYVAELWRRMEDLMRKTDMPAETDAQ